jgi:hypothetical protein
MRALSAALVVIAGHHTVSGQAPDSATWITGAFDVFTTDDLGNVYTVQGDLVQLHAPDGRLLARNSAKMFGRITTIDAFYSLKPLVFSREQRQFAVLDNTLSLQGSVIDLSRNGFPWVSLMCGSVQNCFWFFDEREFSLTRVDQQLRPLATTGRLDQLLGHSPSPVHLVESGNMVYLCEPGRGVHVFDLFGTYLRTLPVMDADQIQVTGGNVYYLHDDTLRVFDPLTLEAHPFTPLPARGARLARMQKDRIYMLTGKGIGVHYVEHGRR